MPLPGDRGGDLLVLLEDEAMGVFRPAVGLEPAADGAPVRAHPDEAIEGRGVVRDRAHARSFADMVRAGTVRRWRLRDAEGGVTEGRYRLASFTAADAGAYEIACIMRLEPARAGAPTPRRSMKTPRDTVPSRRSALSGAE